jgi:uncharacterized phage protein gp47/JayE
MSTTSPLTVPIPSIEQLTQNAARLLQQSLAQATQAAGVQGLSGTDLDLARSNVRALAFVQGVGLHGAYRYLRDFVSRQGVPAFSSGAFLDGWLATYGMARKPATLALGTVNGTGVNGSLLPAGTLMQTAAGAQFRTTADAVVAAGAVAPAIAALVEGPAGNLAAATALTLVSPVAGVDSGFTATAGLAGGADLESDELALARLTQRLSFPPMGGAPADYARWALEVPGITRAWGLRNPAGPCTAGVIVMADVAGASTLPSPAQRQAVEDYIRDPLRGPPDELHVLVPTLVPVNLTVLLSPDTASIRAGVLAALGALFFREAVPGQSLPQSHVNAEISGVVGEYNFTIQSPTIVSGGFFTVPSFAHLLTLGSVAFA